MSHSWSRARANRLWLLQAPMTRARRPLEIYPYFHRHLALDSSFDCRVCSCLPIILLTQKKELFNTKTEPICMQFAEWIISVSEIVGWIRCPGSIVVRRRLVTWESTFFQRSRLANGPTFWKLGLRRYDFDAAHDEREGWTRGYCFFFKDYQTKTPWNDLKRRCPRILAACFLSFSPRAAVPSLQSQPGKLKWVPAMSWWWLLPVAYVVVRLEIPSWCMPCMARCLLCPWRRDDPSWELMEELGQGDNGGGNSIQDGQVYAEGDLEGSGKQSTEAHVCDSWKNDLWVAEDLQLHQVTSRTMMNPGWTPQKQSAAPRSQSWTARCFIEGLQVKGFWCDVEGDQRECRSLGCRNCFGHSEPVAQKHRSCYCLEAQRGLSQAF